MSSFIRLNRMVGLRPVAAPLFHRPTVFVVTVMYTQLNRTTLFSAVARSPPCQPVQQVPRRVVLPAFQIPLILRTARRDAPRRVVEIVRFAPPAVPFLRQFIPSVVVVLTVSERVRHHPAHPTVRFPALHPPCWVVYLPRVQPPLASEHLPVQVVARELADDLTVQVYLLEMPAAVVKLSLRSAVRGKVVAKHIPHVVMPSDGGFLPQSQRLSITLPVNKISDHYFR